MSRALVTTLALALAAAGLACSPADPEPTSPGTERTEQSLSSLPCTSNADCDAQSYCVLPTGQCSGQGTCGPRPRLCPLIMIPVCGCDGGTYGNACQAARAGTNVARRKTVQQECGDR
jgi:hypothetical protein